MADPSLKGLIESFTRHSKIKTPSLKGNVNPNRMALKGLMFRVGPRHNRVKVKI